jgi:hypothetical protein
MPVEAPLTFSQHVAQIGLFLVAVTAMFGGSLQMYLGQPDTSPRLDNVHRFMARCVPGNRPHLPLGRFHRASTRLSHLPACFGCPAGWCGPLGLHQQGWLAQANCDLAWPSHP